MNRLGFFSMLAIVALRLCLGWHFYKEGAEKVSSGKFTASGFLGGATGPLAGMYHGMVWDRDGEFRLDETRTLETWNAEAEAFKRKFRLDDDQQAQVDALLKSHQAQLKYVLESNASDIEEYELGRDRMKSLGEDPTRESVSSLRGQRDTIRTEWKQKGAKALKQIDQVWKNLEESFNGILSLEERNYYGNFKLHKPRLGFVDTTVIDRVLPYFDLTIGVCLVLGLFVRLAGVAGGLFLVSVVLSQFPDLRTHSPRIIKQWKHARCSCWRRLVQGTMQDWTSFFRGFGHAVANRRMQQPRKRRSPHVGWYVYSFSSLQF